jgi:hypothetical protein
VIPDGEPGEPNPGARAITPARTIADTESMGNSSFMQRSYRIAPDAEQVVCDTIALRPDVDALLDAIAWRRDALSRVELQDAETVLGVRALIVLQDMLESLRAYEQEVPLTLTRAQACMLCEIAGAYVAERDVESYQAPEERERIERLRAFAGPMMDCCSELAAAQDELRERPLTV